MSDDNKIFEKARNLILKERNKLKLPNFIVVKITEDCNLRCDYCYAEGGKGNKTIDIKDVVCLFDQISFGNCGTDKRKGICEYIKNNLVNYPIIIDNELLNIPDVYQIMPKRTLRYSDLVPFIKLMKQNRL